MMKNILVILTFLFSVALTGCGSNSKSDGEQNAVLSDVLELEGQEILQAPNGTDFSLTLPFKKLIGEAYLVELNSFSLEVTGGCSINTITYNPAIKLSFDGGEGSVETLYISGTFDANCTPTGYTLTATQKITSGNQSDTRQVSFMFDYSGSVDLQPEDGYSFYNATTPLAISEADTKYQIKVQLLKDGYVAVGETIKLRPFDNTYGDIAIYEASTGSDGYVTFEYTSPETLPAYGSSVTLTADYFVDENASITPKEIVLNFTASAGPEVDTTGMELLAVPSTVNISEAGESRALSLYLANTATHEPVADKDIRALWFDPNSGTLNSYLATTDSNGQVVFNYTAPETLPSGSFNITFEVLNGTPGLQRDVTVNFTSTSTPTVNTATYNMHAVPGSINISEDGESRVVSLFLEDTSTSQPVEGQEIIAHFFNPASGTLSAYSGITNANGQVVFEYTAPASIAGATDFDIIFSIPNATNSHDTNVAVNFTSTSTPTVDTTNYNLTAVPASVNISEDGESRALALYLNNTSTMQPVEGQEIIAHFFDPAKGTLSIYSGITNANGQVVFNYTAPESISGLSDFDITFSIPNATNSHETNVAVNFTSTSTPTVNTDTYNLTVIPETLVISKDGESRELSLFLNDTSTSQPVEGQEIIAHFFNPSSGTLNAYSGITNANGQVVFEYTAPASIAGVADFNITFSIPNATNSHDTNVAVSFSSMATTEYEFINISNIEINHASEKRDVKAQLLYDGTPITGKTVTMNGFDEGNGTLITPYTVQTDSLGYAVFTYMAPADLSEVNGTTFAMTIHFDEGSTHLEENITVIFNETTDSYIEDTTLPVVVIPLEQRIVTLNSNSMTIELALKVFKDIAPYTEGSVKVELPEKVLDGVDVGQFDAYEVNVNELGIATFIYTGPSNLQALISNDDNGSIFKFYHVENSEDKQNWTVEYTLPDNPYVSRNYELNVITSNDFSMGIPDKEKTFNVFLKAKDPSGNEVALTDENITNITVTTTNATIAQILDTDSSTLVNTLSLIPVNNSAFILVSKDKSGLVPLEVSITFDDANGEEQNLSTVVNVRVFSGPPSAISISYVSTSQDASRAKYIETLAISVTDEYGNKVNTRPNVTLGAIVGYAVDGSEASSTETNETKRLFYGKSDIDLGYANGEIDNAGDSDPSTTTFTDTINTDVFQYVNVEGNNTDKLVVFGERKNYEAMGKWDMELGGANNILVLQDQYYGVNRDGLYFAVGHNYYQDLCREDGREWIGTTDSETYQLDEEGTVTVDYRYDYHLTGKDALIWVNLDGYQPDTGKQIRVGEVTKHTLRGTGFVQVPSDGHTFKGLPGDDVNVTFEIWHENAPEAYRNAHFTHSVESGSTCSWQYVKSSNDYDARTCDNGYSSLGRSYVTYTITIPGGQESCTFDIENIMVAQEF